MRIIKKCLLWGLIFSIFNGCCVSADSLTSSYTFVTRDNGTLSQIITIEGNSDVAANKRIALKVWNDGKDAEQFIANESEEGVEFAMFAVFKQTEADNEGNFNFVFPLNKAYSTSIAKADIMIEGSSEIHHLDIPVGNVTPLNNLLQKLNSDDSESVTASEISTFLNMAEEYGIDNSIYNRMGTDKDAVDAKITNELIELAETEDITVEILNEVVSKNIILTVFDSCEDKDLLIDALDVYDDYLELSSLENAEKIYDTYLSLEEKGDALILLNDGDYENISEVIDAFKEAVIVRALEECSYYMDIATVIEDNSDYLDFDSYDDYEESSNLREYVQKYIIKEKNIDSVEELREAFEDAVDAYAERNKKNDKKSSGGGGGGSSVTVSPELTAPVVSSPVSSTPVYNDISGHWAATEIYELTKSGVLSGKPDGSFAPNANITREEFAKLVVEAFDISMNAGGSDIEFSDVSSSRWSYEYIKIATSRGILLGRGDGKFSPDEVITRQDMATILYRALSLKEPPVIRDEMSPEFKDFDEVSDYAKNSIIVLSYLNIINGDGENFNPMSNATRAEAAKVIYNSIKE